MRHHNLMTVRGQSRAAQGVEVWSIGGSFMARCMTPRRQIRCVIHFDVSAFVCEEKLQLD